MSVMITDQKTTAQLTTRFVRGTIWFKTGVNSHATFVQPQVSFILYQTTLSRNLWVGAASSFLTISLKQNQYDFLKVE